MKRQTFYYDYFFEEKIVRDAITIFKECFGDTNEEPSFTGETTFGYTSYGTNEFEDFFLNYRNQPDGLNMNVGLKRSCLSIMKINEKYVVTVKGPDRTKIEKIFSIFEIDKEKYKIVPPPETKLQPKPIIVYIGHGRSPVWKELKDHLSEKHGLKIEAYEIGARAGHTIRDILEQMMVRSSFALLVMTGEDLTDDGKLRARQNVVHETGLFQGKLGFNKAIALVEDGVEVFSNLDGVQQLRFSKGNIKEVFGDVLAILKREFGNLI